MRYKKELLIVLFFVGISFSLFFVIIQYFYNSSRNSLITEDTVDEIVSSSCITNDQASTINNQTSEFRKNIVKGAQFRTQFDVTYIDKAYGTNNGKPPDNEGVCTDHFWRALDYAGIDFQKLLFDDMTNHTNDYPLRIWNQSRPQKTIDFRRVPNIEAYLDKYAQKLTTEIVPCDFENLMQWQPGDILIFKIKGAGTLSDHIAIVSDKRDENGIPYLLHNYGSGEVERPSANWYRLVVGHYRLEL
jgi:uncharacterized protein